MLDSGRLESQTELRSQPAVNATQNTVPVLETDEEIGEGVDIKATKKHQPTGKTNSGMDLTQ